MAPETPPRLEISIEPFDPSKHDRSSFSCGTPRIDNFLQRTAKKHQRGDFTRVWVALQSGNDSVLGYYALNAHALEADDLPAHLTKHAPSHGGIPAVYLSSLGVDHTMQGRGLGRILLADALRRTGLISEEMGVTVVVLDVLEDGDQTAIERRERFYRSMGFLPFPTRAMRMFLPTATIRQLLAE